MKETRHLWIFWTSVLLDFYSSGSNNASSSAQNCLIKNFLHTSIRLNSKFKYKKKRYIWYSPHASTLDFDVTANQIPLTFQGFGFFVERLEIHCSHLVFCWGGGGINLKAWIEITFIFNFAQKWESSTYLSFQYFYLLYVKFYIPNWLKRTQLIFKLHDFKRGQSTPRREGASFEKTDFICPTSRTSCL